jgi:hypothetical protein
VGSLKSGCVGDGVFGEEGFESVQEICEFLEVRKRIECFECLHLGDTQI